MEWSNNVWKQATVIDNNAPKPIITDNLVPLAAPSEDDNMQVFNAENQALRQQIMTDAQQAAEALKAQAFAEGQAAGYEVGYNEGKAVGDQMAQQISMEAEQNYAAAQADIATYLHDKEAEIVAFAVAMAGQIVKKQIDLDETTIGNIIAPTLLQLGQPDQLITVTANPAHREVLTAKLEAKKAEIPNLHYLLLDDMQYELTALKVETSDTLVVFDLETELKNLLVELQKVG